MIWANPLAVVLCMALCVPFQLQRRNTSFPKVSTNHNMEMEPSHHLGSPKILTLFLHILFSKSSKAYTFSVSLIVFTSCFNGFKSSSIKLILPSKAIVRSQTFCASCLRKLISFLIPLSCSVISQREALQEFTASSTSFEGSSPPLATPLQSCYCILRC